MKAIRIDSRKREYTMFSFDIEKYISLGKLKSAFATVLNLDESQVAVYSYRDIVDSYDDVVLEVRYFKKNFKTHIEIHNIQHAENPLTIASALSIELVTPILVDALGWAPIWIMCNPDGNLSYVNMNEDDSDNDAILNWLLSYPCRPFNGIGNWTIDLKQESMEFESSLLIHKFEPYLHSDYVEIHLEFWTSELPEHRGQHALLSVWGVGNSGERAFLDIEDIYSLAFKFELISVLANGNIDTAKNLKFKLSKDSLILEQDKPGRPYQYSMYG